VRIHGLKSLFYLDKADQGIRKQDLADAIHIVRETNRVYLNATGTVRIEDRSLGRMVTIEKSGSQSTVVWNPWTTQLLPDFGVEEHVNMVCVESGNVGANRVKLDPGQTARLKVSLQTAPIAL
jgi:glucose-6-phosphate 1-epimerase